MSKLPKGNYKPGKYNKQRICVICLTNFDIGTEITYLPCDPRHHFHTNCIERWFNNFLKCPICNTPITIELLIECMKYQEMVEFIDKKDEESFELAHNE